MERAEQGKGKERVGPEGFPGWATGLNGLEAGFTVPIGFPFFPILLLFFLKHHSNYSNSNQI